MIGKKELICLGALLMLTFWTQKSFSQCYELVWAEEFNYTGFPDPAVWNMEVGNNNGANNESQYYTRNDSDNCWIDNGLLTITARKENYGGQAYTSARINTKGKAEFKYGKIEGRLRLPYSQGIWPAFWTLGGNIDQVSWPQCGEIDVMELIGGADPRDRTTYGTPHWADANGNHAMYGGSKTLPSGKFNDDFHIFSIEWTPLKITWFLDGVQFHVMSTTPASLSEFHHNHFIILNLAVGGDWPGYPNSTTVFPQKFEIDYVRVYQDLQGHKIEGKDSVLANEKNLSFSLAEVEGRSYEWVLPEGAVLLTSADSSTVAADWGCTAGEIICNVSTTCSTEYVYKKNIGIVHPKIEGPMFYDKSAGNIFFSIPALLETDYSWTIPEGGTFINGDTSNIAEVTWGALPGMVAVTITNACGESTASKKVLKYGQYPYPDPESPFLIPGTINSTNYDYGGEGVAYHDVDIANQGPGPRKDERVDTENQPLFPNVGWITTGEWLEYTIKVPEAGYYRIELEVASQNNTNIGPMRILINGESRINDILVPSTGSWTKFVTVSERLLYLNTTDTALRIEAVKGGFNLGPITILVDRTVSIKDISPDSRTLRLYPNPVKDELNIVFQLLKPGDVKINVLDISGKHLFASDFKGLPSGEQRISVSENIRNLNSGMYLIELNTETQKYFLKFLKD